MMRLTCTDSQDMFPTSWDLERRICTHNPEVAGSNPVPATQVRGPSGKPEGPLALRLVTELVTGTVARTVRAECPGQRVNDEYQPHTKRLPTHDRSAHCKHLASIPTRSPSEDATASAESCTSTSMLPDQPGQIDGTRSVS